MVEENLQMEYDFKGLHGLEILSDVIIKGYQMLAFDDEYYFRIALNFCTSWEFFYITYFPWLSWGCLASYIS